MPKKSTKQTASRGTDGAAGALLPGVAVVAAVSGLAAWRIAVYGRREYIVAAMMRKYVPSGESMQRTQCTGTCKDALQKHHVPWAASTRPNAAGAHPMMDVGRQSSSSWLNLAPTF